jgi:ATP-binding cassette subfamily B protein
MKWTKNSHLSRVIQLISPYRWLMVGTVFSALLLSYLSIVRPMLSQKAVDGFIQNKNQSALWDLTLAMLGLLLAEALVRYVYTISANFLGQKAVLALRKRVYQHITKLKHKFFDQTPIGTLTTRTINDIETIAQIFSEGLLNIISDVLVVVAVLLVMFLENWKLTLVTLTTFPLMMLATYIFKEAVKKSFGDVRKSTTELNAFLQERIVGMLIIQLFSREKKEHQTFVEINTRLNKANMDNVFYYSVFFPVVEVISSAALGLLIWYGGKEALEGFATPGEIIAFIMYINIFFRPVRMLADRFNNLQMGLVASERVFALLDNHEQMNDEGTLKCNSLKGDIDVENLEFEYLAGQKVLHGISFSLPAGQTWAVVGSTGSGKTSLINVISRAYPILAGSVKVDGVKIQEYQLEEYQKHLGVILQDVFLFSGTVFENITLKNPEISLDEVSDVARKTGIDQFIQRLPGGYDYQVKERGSALSAGQRQLIAFLRAMVYNPQILILDEATANIDSITEEILQKATKAITAGRTSLVIAHRLSTIQDADRILVLEKGQIVEQGTHDELLAVQGRYSKLYKKQYQFSEING